MIKHTCCTAPSWALLLVLTLLLNACGGDDDDDQSTPTNTTEPTSLSGKAADGYLRDAKVCLDLNNNSQCDDATEPYAMTIGDEGEYTIDTTHLSNAQINAANVVVEVIKSQTVDMDTEEPVAHGYTLSAPPKAAFVSPLTTLVVETMQNEALSQDAATHMIARKIVGSEGADDFDPTADYIAKKKSATGDAQQTYENAHNVARVIAQTMGAEQDKIKTKLGENVSDDDMQALVDLLVDKVLERLEDIKEKAKHVKKDEPLPSIEFDISQDDVNDHKERLKGDKYAEITKGEGLIDKVWYSINFHDDNEGQYEALAQIGSLMFTNGKTYWKECYKDGEVIVDLDTCEQTLKHEAHITGDYSIDESGILFGRDRISKTVTKNITGGSYIDEHYYFFKNGVTFPEGSQAIDFNYFAKGIVPTEEDLAYDTLCKYSCEKETDHEFEPYNSLAGVNNATNVFPSASSPYGENDWVYWLSENKQTFEACRVHDKHAYTGERDCIEGTKTSLKSHYQYKTDLKTKSGESYSMLVIFEMNEYLEDGEHSLKVYVDFGNGIKKLSGTNIHLEDFSNRSRLVNLTAANAILKAANEGNIHRKN